MAVTGATWCRENACRGPCSNPVATLGPETSVLVQTGLRVTEETPEAYHPLSTLPPPYYPLLNLHFRTIHVTAGTLVSPSPTRTLDPDDCGTVQLYVLGPPL